MNDLMKKVDSRYTLVIVAAKRARMLEDGAPKLIDTKDEKSVSIAINEFYQDKITYQRNS
jgi:DNA-directed RNA polymerase subunit omega